MGEESALEDQLEEKIGYKFRNSALLQEALTHTSPRSSSEGKDSLRLEILGDAVIYLVITNYLYKKFPNANYLQLSNMRETHISYERQKEIANKWKLHKYVKIHRCVRRDFDRYDEFVESIIAAVFIDAGGEMNGLGYNAVARCIYKHWSLGKYELEAATKSSNSNLNWWLENGILQGLVIIGIILFTYKPFGCG